MCVGGGGGHVCVCELCLCVGEACVCELCLWGGGCVTQNMLILGGATFTIETYHMTSLCVGVVLSLFILFKGYSSTQLSQKSCCC